MGIGANDPILSKIGEGVPMPTQPVAYKPIDIQGLEDKGTALDIAGYDLADRDLASRFPGLVSGRAKAISDTYKSLNGPLSFDSQNYFTTRGIENALTSTGGGNSNAGVGLAGSASGNRAAASIVTDVLGKQDQDRAALSGLLADNPERAFGLSGADAATLSTYNTQLENQSHFDDYNYKLALQNRERQVSSINTAQTEGVVNSIVSSL